MSKCTTCNRDAKRMNSEIVECSHVECPHRRHAWSERPSGRENFKGPWPKNVDRDPKELEFK